MLKIEAHIPHIGWTVPVNVIDFDEAEVEVDLSNGTGDTSVYSFNEVELIVSDGYHTFDELYYHRMMLFAVICKAHKERAWKSWQHHDGTMYYDYFIVGITTEQGDYTYHYHKDHWNKFDVRELERAPEWDGHKPDDIDRLLTL